MYDNSADVEMGSPIPDPVLVLDMQDGRLLWPGSEDEKALRHTPDWAKPLVEAALIG